ncbi:uncharacterized protein [Rutidosis leptorrhynchoides]|uniref:uncharacterized protein n=1 Tax=Rutidosis leptorrhynchoides TaxID=125765 RepID=UPI003A9A2B84
MDFRTASWNIRGMSTKNKQDEVIDFIRNERISICDVLETQLKPSNIDKACSYIFGNWSGMSNVNLMVIHVARQVILSIIGVPNGNLGKKSSFRFMNHIADKAEFLDVVAQKWNCVMDGCKMFQVVTKLKMLKKDLHKLNWSHGGVFQKVVDLRDKLKRCQIEVESNPHDYSVRSNATEALLEYEKAKQGELTMLRQKVKIKWLAEGDRNTKFFHCVLKSRKQRSKVESIRDENGSRFYGDQAYEEFEDIFTVKLSSEDAYDMVGPISNMEIKNAMLHIDGNKAAGPDGYSA